MCEADTREFQCELQLFREISLGVLLLCYLELKLGSGDCSKHLRGEFQQCGFLLLKIFQVSAAVAQEHFRKSSPNNVAVE